MRLWTIHPGYLDSRGLVALWREALLAQKVLQGATRGYRRHPQLSRFSECFDSAAAIGVYLGGVADEAERRGYAFDRRKINVAGACNPISATRGQALFEWEHLIQKLTVRAPSLIVEHNAVSFPTLHPLFYLIEGSRSEWERG